MAYTSQKIKAGENKQKHRSVHLVEQSRSVKINVENLKTLFLENVSGPRRLRLTIQFYKVTVIAIYAPMIYMAPYIMFLMDADRSIMRASGRGLGPLNQDIFGVL